MYVPYHGAARTSFACLRNLVCAEEVMAGQPSPLLKNFFRQTIIFLIIEASIPFVEFYIMAGYSFVRRESEVTKDGLLEYDVMHKAFEASETE